MEPLTLMTSAVAGACGAVAGPLLVRLAHRRALAQPLDVDTGAEQRVLGAALAEPAWLSDGEELRGGDFAQDEYGAAWQAAQDAYAQHGEDLDPEQLVEHVTAAVTEQYHEITADAVVSGATEAWGQTAGMRREYLLAGETVMARHEDRTVYTGRAGTERDDDGTFHRRLPRPSTTRTVVVALVTAAALAALPGLATTVAGAGSLAWGLTILTGVLMVGMGVIVSLVDIDTLRIDLGLFTVLGIASWATAAGAAAAAGDLGRVLLAGVATLVIVGLFEVLNFIHKRLRGIDGQGFGDTLLALVTVGVPVALSGSAILAYWALMLAVGAVLVTYLVRRLRGEPAERAKLNPFGPYLAGSWVPAWVGVATGVLPSLW